VKYRGEKIRIRLKYLFRLFANAFMGKQRQTEGESVKSSKGIERSKKKADLKQTFDVSQRAFEF
jgi:hypothetical protein